MTGAKGFDQLVTPEFIASGQLHSPDLSHLNEQVIVEKTTTEQQLAALKAGVSVVTEQFSYDAQQVRSFEVYPDKTIERSRSAHSVGFGRFIGWLPRLSPKGGSREYTLERVAVKPFEDPVDALRELHGYRRLGELCVETFEPRAIFPAAHGSHFLGMTATRKELTSLDRDLWVPSRRVTSERTSEIAERNAKTVDDIARLSAFLNAMGIFLPDGQIKNWAVTPEGRTGAIDTENMTTLPIGSPDAPQMAWECTNQLIKSLILDTKNVESKMFGVGMFSGMPLQRVRDGIEELFILPYVEELELLAYQENTAIEQAHLEALHEGIITNFYNDKSWPGHIVGSVNTRYKQPATLLDSV